MSLPLNLPLLEEIKVEDLRAPLPSLSPKPASKPENSDAVTKLVGICNELVAMGFPERMVFTALRFFEVQDVQSATDLLIKTPYGWSHSFVPSEGNKKFCEICGQVFKEHVESAINNDEEDVPQIMPLTIFEGVDVEKLRTSVLCKICMDGIPLGHEFHLPCGHMHCLKCVKEFLEINITNGVIIDLKCPQDGCNTRFTRLLIQKLCSDETFEKYLKFRENLEVSLNKKLRWCPAPNCGRYVENKRGKSHVVCECGFHMCFKCGEEWHQGRSCTKNFELLYNSWADGKKIQRCPKCKIRIEKDEGCNHMTCGRCRYQWCWICGRRYKPGHYDSAFFGCPMLQFTDTDWSLKKIALYHFIMFLLSPLLTLYFSFMSLGECLCERANGYYTCRCACYLLALLTIIIMTPIVCLVMIIPVMVHRFTNLVYAVTRGFSR